MDYRGHLPFISSVFLTFCVTDTNLGPMWTLDDLDTLSCDIGGETAAREADAIIRSSIKTTSELQSGRYIIASSRSPSLSLHMISTDVNEKKKKKQMEQHNE